MAFFYGWKDEYIEKLPHDVFQSYWMAITNIEAQESLRQIQVFSYPNFNKKTDRNKLWSSLQKMAFNFEREQQELTTEEAAKELAMRLMGG